jgi:hypothetical protein
MTNIEGEDTIIDNDIKTTHGTLYVMRERDYLSGELFDYYKIGIVNGAKDVESRRKSHVTGNPRDIFTVGEYSCLAVQKLETLLHNLYAKNRVHSGEWFVFSEDEVKELVAVIPKWVNTIDNTLNEIEGKRVPESRGSETIASASPPVKIKAERLAKAILEQKAAAANKTLLAKVLVAAAGSNPDFAFMFKLSTRNTGGSFSSTLVKDLDKTLWSAYMTLVEEKDTPKWDLSEFDELTLETGKLDSSALPDSPVQLHQLYLEAWGAEYRWKLEADLLKPVLLIEGADSAGIEGIYHWELVSTTSFDKKRFEDERPEVYDQCFSPKVSKPAIAPAEWASYRT